MKLYIYIYIDIYFYTYMTEALGTLSKLIAAYRLFEKSGPAHLLFMIKISSKKKKRKKREHV